MNLADNLKKIRKDNNLSQEQLAEKLGISRQAVSKWESGISYPEMDKVLQICQMFNLNIDELLNQDIKEIKEAKEAKSNINKFIDDLLNFMTKTFDMFLNMNFKSKVKCLLEQVIIIIILIALFLVFGSIFQTILNKMLNFLDYNHYYYLIFNILEAFYIIFSLISGLLIFIHIFKIRYLDYYITIKNNSSNVQIQNTAKDKLEESEQRHFNKKSETIIIRNPEHFEYKFIKEIVKCILFLLKLFGVFIALCLLFLLVIQFIILVLSFLIIKTGLLFIGCFIIMLASIIINLILLYIIYNLLFNKKVNYFKVLIKLVSSAIAIGIGVGLIVISIKDFNYIRDIQSNYYFDEVKTIPMEDNLVIDNFYNIEFIESNSNDLTVTCRHSKQYKFEINYDWDNHIYFSIYEDDTNLLKHLRENLQSFNNKIIVDHSEYKIYISTTKENIEKIKENNQKYNEEYEEQYDELTNYENKILELEQELSEKQNKISELDNTLKEKDSRIIELENLLEDKIKE